MPGYVFKRCCRRIAGKLDLSSRQVLWREKQHKTSQNSQLCHLITKFILLVEHLVKLAAEVDPLSHDLAVVLWNIAQRFHITVAATKGFYYHNSVKVGGAS